MTTTITIQTVDWPVEVTQTDEIGDTYTRGKIRVEPHSKQTMAIWSNRSLHFKELSLGA